MATKWNRFTWNPLVKLAVFVAAVLCLYAGVFLSINEFLLAERLQNYSGNLHYNYRNSDTVEEYAGEALYDALESAARIAAYDSRDNIADGGCIEILADGVRDKVSGNIHTLNYNDPYSQDDSGLYAYESRSYGPDSTIISYQAGDPSLKESRIEELRQIIQREQLEDFTQRLEDLRYNGVEYQIHTKSWSYSLGNPSSLPYRLELREGKAAASFDTRYDYGSRLFQFDQRGNSFRQARILLAVDGEAYHSYQQNRQILRDSLKVFLQRMLVIGAAGLLFVVVLSTGAGRRADSGEGLHFLLWDRIYLDLSLTFSFLFSVFLLLLAESFRVFYQIDPNKAEHLPLISGVIVVPFVLLLLWYLGFVKQFKKGKWWRHTFLYQLAHRIAAGSVRILRAISQSVSLWNNRIKLAAGCVLSIGFFALFHEASAYSPDGFLMFLLASFLSAFLLWFHYRNLDALQRGISSIEQGHYGEKIPVRWGSYLSLATSIQNISLGMDEAVRRQTRSERMKTELITNVSHDLRTPLTSLITYTDLLKKEGLQSEHAPEYLEVLIQKSQRLKELTDDLFEAAKAASGSIAVHCEPLDMSQLVRQALGELDEQIGHSGLEFRATLPERSPVCADGRLVGRMVENLLSNVLKYAMPGSRVYIDLSEEDGYCRLDVKNISKEPLNIPAEELTERFKRGDESRHSDGSGLGLSIVQSFAAAQGGELRLRVDGDLFKASVFLPIT